VWLEEVCHFFVFGRSGIGVEKVENLGIGLELEFSMFHWTWRLIHNSEGRTEQIPSFAIGGLGDGDQALEKKIKTNLKALEDGGEYKTGRRVSGEYQMAISNRHNNQGKHSEESTKQDFNFPVFFFRCCSFSYFFLPLFENNGIEPSHLSM
jgi:hypothetical protein